MTESEIEAKKAKKEAEKKAEKIARDKATAAVQRIIRQIPYRWMAVIVPLILAAGSSLAVAMFPTIKVKEPGRLAYQINGIVERKGVIEYAYRSTFTDKFPDKYINTDDAPQVKDMVIILREKGDDEIYFYRDTPGKKYDDWHQAVWDVRKEEKRQEETESFLIYMGAAIATGSSSFRRLCSKVFRRLWNLIPKNGKDEELHLFP